MKKSKYQFFTIALALLTLWAALPACTSSNKKKAHVMIVFSYDKNHRMYKEFLEEVQQTFSDGGYKAEIEAIYMDMENSHKDFRVTLKEFKDSMDRKNWKPDIILTEGDRPARSLIRPEYDTIFDFRNTPMVLGALHHPNAWQNLKGRPNIAKWYDPMDFCKNIDLAVKLTGVNLVEIELDHDSQDTLLRKELAAQISRPPYINNMDFHDNRLDDYSRTTILKDSIMVLVYSAQYPWSNMKEYQSEKVVKNPEAGNLTLHGIYTFSWKYPQLVVKKDIYADLIATKSGRPQFTAVKSDFGNGKGNYLAGYFASYRTIAHDISETALQILNGTAPNRIEMREHQKKLWMDYDAMERLGMKYQDYAKDYHIINAPYQVEHSRKYMAIIGLNVLIIVAILSLLGILLYRLRKHILQRDRRSLEESTYITRLCLLGADSYQITSFEEMEKYLKYANPGQEETLRFIRNTQNIPGEYRFQLTGKRLGREDENFELRFVVRKNMEVNGVLLNISERVRQHEQMELAMKASKESQKKDNFMMKTSQAISTPLDAIRSYCQNLTTENLSEEEKMELSEKITRNREQLTTIINDILLFSRIESGRQQYFMKDVKVEDLLQHVYKEWISPIQEHHSHVHFNLQEGRAGIIVKTDKDRVGNILDQFISNAIKFTESGNVNIGWRYYIGKKEVEIFVEDEGIGISKERQKEVFSLFWQANNFVTGVGLGLNIAKRLAENIDGKILVSSQEGVGSKFSLVLKTV